MQFGETIVLDRLFIVLTGLVLALNNLLIIAVVIGPFIIVIVLIPVVHHCAVNSIV